MSNIKTIILCGGKGTRMSELTHSIPKPMATIGGEPILCHIMERYSHYGFKDFVLPLGYKGGVIKDFFSNYYQQNSSLFVDLESGNLQVLPTAKRKDWKIWMVDTGEDTEKGSRIKRVEDYIDSELFMVTYGDGVADIDINKLIEFHKKHGKLATFCGVKMPSRFGTVETNDYGEVTSWKEKPILPSYVNCGFFVFNRKVLDYLELDPSCDLEKEPLEKIASEGQLMMFKHDGFWKCMDTLRDNTELNKMWSSNVRPWMEF